MSVSASAENLTTEAQSCDGGSMCLELALEGERLCKAGDCRAGVAFFQAAIQAGTEDLRTLSAIYSQLGNAYFYLGDYGKAMQYHKHDLTLARSMNDKLGEAKASGNLGNTLKVMGKFAEAIQCCKRHLEISRALGDRLSEGRALYNLGNVYHAQGKHLGRLGQSDPGHFPQEVRDCLTQAVTYYEENLELMLRTGDRLGAGRARGNLGNTCYLLGDFAAAIRHHTERLGIARELGDRVAERRANSNLANSHIFLGQFENAAEHYKRTLALAEAQGEAAVEAQACYSLGNTYTLLREHRAAEQYHARHLAAARRLRDRVGEARAAWALGNAHAALGNHEKALYFANEHLNISKERSAGAQCAGALAAAAGVLAACALRLALQARGLLLASAGLLLLSASLLLHQRRRRQLGDALGMATAQMNIADLRRVLGLPEEAPPPAPAAPAAPADDAALRTCFNALRVRRQSMEQLSLIQLTPDGKKKEELETAARGESEENPVESFFELLSRCQSDRYDEQRAPLAAAPAAAPAPAPAPAPDVRPRKLQRSASSGHEHKGSNEAMLDMITDLQSERMDSQRAELRPLAPSTAAPSAAAPSAAAAAAPAPRGKVASLPGLRHQQTLSDKPEDDFLDMIARVQGTRLDDQRTEMPKPKPEAARGRTVPDDDFFALLMRAQAGRMEDQRAAIPVQNNRGKNGANPKK